MSAERPPAAARGAFMVTIYGLVTSFVLAAVFCCERGLLASWRLAADVPKGEWALLAAGMVGVWGFVALMKEIGVPMDSRARCEARGAKGLTPTTSP